jgi:NAD(P)-dependent dehydrogenase (short-subunit alcohol dehydrogenase family)
MGAAHAEAIVREGGSVLIGDVLGDAGIELAERLGDAAEFVQLDVTSEEAWSHAVARAVARFGGVDVLVNNAGIAIGHAVEDTPLADFIRVMNTNVWGTLRCIQAVLPSMRERGSGHILNVTSTAGRVAVAGQSAYTMSKFAAEALTESLAAEVAPFGIHVSAIEPGVIETPIFEKALADPEDPTTPYVGGRRIGEFYIYSLLNDPATPDLVAEVIWQAISADEPKLRYLAGADAKALVAHRGELSDEEWITRQADPDDNAWRAWIKDVTGVEIPPT